MKAMSRELRSWRINKRSDKTLDDLAHMFNKVVQGWINYYGRFYKSMLYPLLRRINEYLVRWARRKIQAAAAPRPVCTAMVGTSRDARADPVCALEVAAAARRLDNGSGVS